MEKVRKRGKRGLSPIVTTVLLISIVVILAAIIFLWARGLIKEVIEKEIAGEKKKIESFCPDINLEAHISSSGELSIINRGNIPIFKIKIKKRGRGTSQIQEVEEEIIQGGVFSVSLGSDLDYEEIIIIPVLLGTSNEEYKEKPCDESYGIVCVNQDGTFVC